MSNRTVVLRTELEKLASEEACWAIENWGEYKNLHEAYAVLLEEIEEAGDEMSLVYQAKTKLWQDTKDQVTANAHADAHTVLEASLRAAAELVQVAAVAKKILRLTHTDTE